MSKKTNKHPMHNMFHVTVSPKSGDVSVEILEKLKDLLVKKDIEKYCYVIEFGKNKDHPHLHILLQYTGNKRQDTVKTSVINKAKKFIVVTKYLVIVKTAWNPQYLLTEYMQKEEEMHNYGFDLKNIKKEFNLQKREVYNLDSQLIPVTRASFVRLYREMSKECKIKYSLKGYNDHVNEFIDIAEEKGYAIYPFYFWNKTQCNNIIKKQFNDFYPEEIIS